MVLSFRGTRGAVFVAWHLRNQWIESVDDVQVVEVASGN